jgi:hypothetical protein
MPDLTDRTRTTRGPAPLALSVVLVLAAALLVAVTPRPSPGAAPAERAQRWVGYRIPRTGTAAGGWIGGYRLGDARLYVTTPSKRRNRAGYEPPQAVGDLHESRGASRGETRRAAWILSKYGGYRDATQAAAVDAAVKHLLAPKRWRISAGAGSRRIRQARESASVRRFARLMLAGSRRSAGVYRAQVSAVGADVGGTIEVAVSVTDGHGAPASGLPVTLAAAGEAPVAGVTGDDGRAVARFPAGQRGWRDVAATVHEVPEHRLLLRAPVRRRQASAAEGGVKRTILVGAAAPVRGPQSLALALSPATITVGSPTRVLATVAGDGTPRTVTGTLHGPFSSAAAADCTGSPSATVTATVAADGQHALPTVSPGAGGYHVWRVAVDGTATSLPVSACSSPVRVRSITRTTVWSDAPTMALGEVGATGEVADLPFPVAVILTGTLYGPYASEAQRSADLCGTSAGSVARTRTGVGRVHFTLEALQPGYYAWRAETPPGDLWLGSSSPCLAAGSLLHVP